ncbi:MULTISPECIES: DUF6414 family protein [unclassified Agromyces]|uniref:DUF6414 family protein n=1 Tax=unclassified Agromyces TaxID=2639701 RepID=UPI0030143E5B
MVWSWPVGDGVRGSSGGNAMTVPGKQATEKSLIKVVYFDEESASDYLDISAGGKADTTSENVRDRTTKMHGEVETRLSAKFSWLPFLGATAETGAGIDLSSAGQSILRKTLSNTILTDYLAQVKEDSRVERLSGLRVTAAKSSMAYMKMFTPYMIIARTEDQGLDLARLDEALAGAKGYYELVGEDSAGLKRVLRFNIKAFRNNYGLADLTRMRLIFHGVLVGQASEDGLGIEAEMSLDARAEAFTAVRLVDGGDPKGDLLDVYDVILAGVEHAA